MDKLSIRIKIADREYPMKVSVDEEERIRKAGKLLNEKIKHFREQFGIDDKQDLLAMVAFDSLVEKMSLQDNSSASDEAIVEKIRSINHKISQAI